MPFALAVVGSAGSGKSTVALEIARRSGGIYLDKDRLAGPLVEAIMSAQGQSVEERESNSFYREQIMPAEYEALFAVANDNLRLGLSVVIDAPFAAYLDKPEFFEHATATWPDVNCAVLNVVTSEDETRRRLRQRGLPRDRAKLSNWDEFWSRWGELAINWTGVRVFEANNDDAPNIAHVLEHLQAND
ncbi:AAA family ATPase [Microbacterium sp. AGC85]